MPSACLADTPLEHALVGQVFFVKGVKAPDHAPEWGNWLAEIGFVAGEHVKIIARAVPGGDPLVVRVGQSTFALRRAEAACIQVVAAHSMSLSSKPLVKGSV